MTPLSGPVLITGDQRLVAAVGRAAAAAGVVPVVHAEARTAVADWAAAAVVLLGTDRLGEVAGLALARRSQVFVLGTAEPGPEELRDALRCGASSALVVPADEEQLVDLLVESTDGGAAGGLLVGVVGGTGGAGASTFATALGLELARTGGSALLVDADSAGGGVDQVLGLGAGEGVRWDALSHASGRLSARSLRDTLPASGGLSVVCWSTDRGSGLVEPALRSVLAAGRRGYPVVVVDLPRTATSVLEEVLPRCDRVIVVCTRTLPALAACLQLRSRLPASRAAVVLRGRGGLDAPSVEHLLGVPVWHQMADQRGLDEQVSLGLGPVRRRGPLARAARQVAARIGEPRW